MSSRTPLDGRPPEVTTPEEPVGTPDVESNVLTVAPTEEGVEAQELVHADREQSLEAQFTEAIDAAQKTVEEFGRQATSTSGNVGLLVGAEASPVLVRQLRSIIENISLLVDPHEEQPPTVSVRICHHQLEDIRKGLTRFGKQLGCEERLSPLLYAILEVKSSIPEPGRKGIPSGSDRNGSSPAQEPFVSLEKIIHAMSGLNAAVRSLLTPDSITVQKVEQTEEPRHSELDRRFAKLCHSPDPDPAKNRFHVAVLSYWKHCEHMQQLGFEPLDHQAYNQYRALAIQGLTVKQLVSVFPELRSESALASQSHVYSRQVKMPFDKLDSTELAEVRAFWRSARVSAINTPRLRRKKDRSLRHSTEHRAFPLAGGIDPTVRLGREDAVFAMRHALRTLYKSGASKEILSLITDWGQFDTPTPYSERLAYWAPRHLPGDILKSAVIKGKLHPLVVEDPARFLDKVALSIPPCWELKDLKDVAIYAVERTIHRSAQRALKERGVGFLERVGIRRQFSKMERARKSGKAL